MTVEGRYTGRRLQRVVTYLARGPAFGIPDGYVVMSVGPVPWDGAGKGEDRTHRLKTWPEPFRALRDHSKRFEYRRDDRGYRVGDLLILEEFVPTDIDSR